MWGFGFFFLGNVESFPMEGGKCRTMMSYIIYNIPQQQPEKFTLSSHVST